MRVLLLACLLCLSALPAAALELAGAKIGEQAQVADRQLVLNGAGIRSILFLKVYAGALYLGEKTQNAAAVLGDEGAKRVSLHVTAGEVGIGRFLGGLRSGIEKNCTAQEVAALHQRMTELDDLFHPVKNLKRGMLGLAP